MISIIIPALNEPYLPYLVRELMKINNSEILIQSEMGLGYAVRCGIKRARGDKMIVMDGDGQHNPQYIPIFVRALDKYDMVIGSKYIGMDNRSEKFRKFISFLLTHLIRMKLRNGVTDPLSGYFGFRKEILDGVKLECNGFKIGLEIMMKTNPKIKEIPIVFGDRKMGKSKVNFKEVINLVNLIVGGNTP